MTAKRAIHRANLAPSVDLIENFQRQLGAVHDGDERMVEVERQSVQALEPEVLDAIKKDLVARIRSESVEKVEQTNIWLLNFVLEPGGQIGKPWEPVTASERIVGG